MIDAYIWMSFATMPGPTRLVVCADACSIIPVEVLVKEEVVAPVSIGLELLHPAEQRSSACMIR